MPASAATQSGVIVALSAESATGTFSIGIAVAGAAAPLLPAAAPAPEPPVPLPAAADPAPAEAPPLGAPLLGPLQLSVNISATPTHAAHRCRMVVLLPGLVARRSGPR